MQSAQAWTLDPSAAPGNGTGYRAMREVAQSVVDSCAAVNAAHPGVAGVVVGATAGTTGRAHDLDLSRLAGPVLVPGLGAQGATPADLAEAFAAGSGPVIPSSSREILATGPDPEALHEACAALNGSLAVLGLPAGPVGA